MELGFSVGGSRDGYDGWKDGWTDEWMVRQDGGNGQQGQVGQVRQVGAGGQDVLPEHERCPREAS